LIPYNHTRFLYLFFFKMGLAHLLAFALSLSISAATHQGFNYGATKSDGSFNQQSDFQSQFQTAKSLVGASGFNSARLYTMIAC
jgi:glucan endo-1,3-beta-D-glucosidase